MLGASDSPIVITDAFASERVTQSGGYGGPGLFGALVSAAAMASGPNRLRSFCTTFANRDPRDVQLARLYYLVVDRAGKVVGMETLDSKGPFAQKTDDSDSGIVCQGIQGKFDKDTLMYQPRDGSEPVAVGRIVFTPAWVEFVDGTKWSAPNPPAIGSLIPKR